MNDLLPYLLAAFGLAYIVGHAKISLVPRLLLGGSLHAEPPVKPLVPVVGPFLVDLAECPACFGFWVGLVYALAVGGGFGDALWLGCLTSGSNFLLGRLTKLI